ncbi:hypothetical protein QBC40DRAFT_251183 [Triangularia verruculosa]|uniref:Uncharacterized protein n=1 Tax=Triangularia verruculosa TaxID=2587418 RepID=A0AAN7AYC5_9PEZI|nr:hypothetical protein QBC40DRAFT_251183 [Triangularia verruculosa]
MVSFRKLAAAALAASAPVMAALTPAGIVVAIKDLTAKSQALQQPAHSISLINGPLIVVGLGPFPQIIVGFTQIINVATTAVPEIATTPAIDVVADRQAVADAFKEFVRVHQVLLNILIGKAGLFTTVPFIGAPVTAILRQLESTVDAFAFAVIDVVASQDGVPSSATSLTATLDAAIKSYEGLQLTKRENAIPVAAIKAAPIAARA